jgi:hypothetical protein
MRPVDEVAEQTRFDCRNHGVFDLNRTLKRGPRSPLGDVFVDVLRPISDIFQPLDLWRT